MIGAILAPGKRTGSADLRVMGAYYQRYHRVLNRAVWSSRQASFILLLHLMAVFVPTGPLILGLDDTIERRWGNTLRREESTVTRCVPVTVTSSKPVDCDG